MIFTTLQSQAIKAEILADPTMSAMADPAVNNYQGICDILNADAAGPFVVWRTTTPLESIRNAIDWAKMTPAQSLDATVTQTNRFLIVQSKQINLNSLITGATSIPSGLANIRSAFQDALTALPTKSDGTNQPAGWTAVQTAMQRNARRYEKVLIGNVAAPADLVLGADGKPAEGALIAQQIGAILAS
jgi:hypothetical protein